MNHKKTVFVVGVALVLLTQNFTTLVGAISTTETSFSQTTKLIVSAYGWEYLPATKDASGKVLTPEQRWLTYVQLFNSGSRPLDLSQYSLRVENLDSEGIQNCTPVENCTEITLPGSGEGYLAPGKHVLLASPSAVAGAKYTMAEFLLPPYQKSTMPWFRIVVNGGDERSSEVVAKLDSRTDPANEYADWLRNENSSGSGYYEGFTAVNSAPEQLYDDPLYVVPASPSIRIDEVYPNSQSCAPTVTEIICYDYIKIHLDENVDLKQYVLRTDSNSASRTASNTFWLGSYTPNSDGFVTVYLNDSDQPYSLVNSGYVWLEDVYGLVRYDQTITKYGAQSTPQVGWSWMLPDSVSLGWSIKPSPNVPNLFVPYVPEKKLTVCPEGKYLNPDTGRCRTVEEAVNDLAACAEGQERNPATNRCRKIDSSTTSTLVPCGEGQERNPLTNRCRSIASAVAELIPCDEGYERNPATNRCRKVLGASTASSSSTTPNNSTSQPNATESPWGWLTAGIVGVCALGYAAYEWRSELASGARKLVGRFKQV